MHSPILVILLAMKILMGSRERGGDQVAKAGGPTSIDLDYSGKRGVDKNPPLHQYPIEGDAADGSYAETACRDVTTHPTEFGGVPLYALAQFSTRVRLTH